MQAFEFYCPTKIYFGKGAEARVGEAVKHFGGTKVFIVYGGHSAVKSGLIARIEQTLNLLDHIFGPHIILGTYLVFYLGQHFHVGISQKRYFGMAFLYGGDNGFARFAATVVGRRCQLVFHDRVDEYHFITNRIERYILVFERTAIETNQMTRFPEDRGKLIHYTALYTAIVTVSYTHLTLPTNSLV